MSDSKLPMIIDKHGNPLSATAYRGGSSAWDAASYADQMRTWIGSNGSADTDNIPETDDIRFRARDAERNMAAARATVSTLVQNIVGSQLRVIPKPNYRRLGKTKEWADEWSQQVQYLAAEYFDSTDVDAAGNDNFASMAALVVQSVITNGGALMLPIWRERSAPHRATDYRTAFKLVEIDRLCNEFDQMDGEFLRGGIELDEDGEAIAYHILKHHPGDMYMGWQREWEILPAYTDWGRQRVMHIYSRDRIDAHRGVSWIATSLPDYKHASDYQRYEMTAAAANAIIAMTVESPLPAEMIVEIFGSHENYLQLRAQHKAMFGNKNGPGKVVGLFPGDKLNGFVPSRPNANFGPFMDSILRPNTASNGLPLELVMRNFTTMNYSSMRGMMLEAERTFRTLKVWLKRQMLKPGYALWFEEAVDAGEIPDCTPEDLHSGSTWSAWTGCDWLGDGTGWVDPVKEEQGTQLRIYGGRSSLQRECAARGIDWREVADEQIAERKYYEDRGMAYPGDRDIKGGTIRDEPEDERRHKDV